MFNKTFHFVALKQNSVDIEHTLTSSLVIGYIYFKIANLIPISFSYEIDILCIIASALVLGYVFAKLLRSAVTVKVLDFLKIRDTGNLYYWDDIMDNKYPMKIRVICEKEIYEGMLHNYESYSNDPHIILSSYVIMDKDENVKKDFTDNDSRTIVLNTAEAIAVEIMYAQNSEMCEDLKSLCNSNKKIFLKKQRARD